MLNLENYLQTLNSNELKDSVTKTANEVYKNIDNTFDYKSHLRGLLLGNVQSGKTAQSFGTIAKLADEGFELFIFLTTDSVDLQTQTFDRAKASLLSFDVFGEGDDLSFALGKLKKPAVIILKKNSRILGSWLNHFASSKYCEGRPLVIIDDEADAASLNTKVNKSDFSVINKHLNAIQGLAASSVYLQVTATPQAVLLQSVSSGWKPKFVNYFDPGKEYIGGDFVYSEPRSYCIKDTDEHELDDIKQDGEFIPQGFRNALLTYLMTVAHFLEIGEDTCNFLIHPSVRTTDHEIIAEKIGEHLNLLFTAIQDDLDALDDELKIVWTDLQSTKPDITNFEDAKNNVISLIENSQIEIIVQNSKSAFSKKYEKGFNIIIGGNCLARGVTIPKLQTVYYCRQSRTPQADTFWQHSRMFGYDRDRMLMRVFLPPTLQHLFTELNKANTILFSQIRSSGLEGTQLIYSGGIKPTRSNVVESRYLNLITGGVNYFPNNPKQTHTDKIDNLLLNYSDTAEVHSIDFDLLLDLLKLVESKDKFDWNQQKFVACAKALKTKKPTTKCILIIRRNRNIGKGTGTLLSPNDRALGDNNPNALILTLYRLTGSAEKGWNGKPFWIPNVKFPQNTSYYDTIVE